MNIELACTTRARLKGLYGRSSFDGVLLIAPCHDVHTLGMKRPLDIAFVSSEGVILASHVEVGPNRRLRDRRAAATLERFSCESAWFAPGERLDLSPLHKTHPESRPGQVETSPQGCDASAPQRRRHCAFESG